MCFEGGLEANFTLFWPTSNSAFTKDSKLDYLVQPTESGKLKSGLFGCVRNNGEQFHEGLDLAPIRRDQKGEPIDPIFVAMDGRVVYINRVEVSSNYGLYIVIEHSNIKPTLYTLYAHLRSINMSIEVGDKVNAGDKIGVMGRTAGGYAIPAKRAHLHFEIGLRLSDAFDNWYKKKYSKPNIHGNYNGINLIGIDPLDFYEKYQEWEVDSFDTYIKALPTAYVLRVYTQKKTTFLRRYPELMHSQIQTETIAGWDIHFTWWGLPVGWTALEPVNMDMKKETQVSVLSFDYESLRTNKCRETILLTENGPRIGDRSRQVLEIIFDQL